MQKTAIRAALFLGLVMAMTTGPTMALGKTVTLFSEIRGLLVDAGAQPQAGVIVTQWWREGPDDPGKTVTTTTDADGQFHFAAVEERRFWSTLLPGTPSIKQRITVERPGGGDPLILWQTVKTSHTPLSETRGRAIDIVCRIDAEEDGDGPAWGTCRWASDTAQ